VELARSLDASNVEATNWLYHLNWVDAPEVQVGGYRLEDSNDFTRTVLQVPVHFNDRSFTFSSGVAVARYESNTGRAINRTSLPLQAGLAVTGRTRLSGGYAFHVYNDPHGSTIEVDDTHTGFMNAAFTLSETTQFDAHAAIRDFVDRADPFETVFYNNISDIDVVLNEVRVTETRARLKQALSRTIDATLEGTYGDQTDDNWFRSANLRLEWYPGWWRGFVPRANGHLLYYGRPDETYFSPRDFESFSIGALYAHALTRWWSLRTEHDLLVQPDADDPIGNQHFLETTFVLGGSSYLILDAFHLRAPDSQNPEEDDERYTITRFGARFGVRFE
jgi:hypothetical protein